MPLVGRTVEAEEPLVDQVFHVGGSGADRQVAQSLALIFGVGRGPEHDVFRQLFHVTERAEQRRSVDDRLQVGDFRGVDRAAVFRVAEQGNDVVAVDQVVGVERAAERAKGRVLNVCGEPVARGRRRWRRWRGVVPRERPDRPGSPCRST